MYHEHHQSKSLIFGLAACLVVGGDLSYAHPPFQYPNSVNAVLDDYGFTTAEQKQALRFLMKKAGIEGADALLDQKAIRKEVLIKLILDLVEKTQNKFTVRTGQKERWEVETPDWMKEPKKQAEVLSALKTLKMMGAVPPTFKKPDAICVLGASKSVMASRLDYAGKLVTENTLSTNWLIMLAGERSVTPDKNGVQVDGSEQELKDLAEKIGKTISTLTETDLMKTGYEASALYGKFPDNRVVLIDTPKRDLPRPTTETTVTELCAWLRQHPEVHEITFISNQPHVEYQRAIIAQVFEKQGVKLKFEAVGPEYVPVVNNDADKINYILQALGSRIWAKTPEVLDKIGFDVSEPELRERYMALYQKQPLIYNNLKVKLPKPRPH